MTLPVLRPAALLVGAVLAAAAPVAAQCTLPASVQAHAHGHAHGHGGMTAPARASGDTARWTAADVRFMTTMIGHHAQALEMSELAPTRAGDNSIRILAARIHNAQADEIVTMQTWLRDRGQPIPDAHAHHAGDHALMPGMLTSAQMAELAAASGGEFDRLFLTYMIQHHRGATCMVSELFGSHGAGQDEAVFRFATDVNVDQTTEIARMQRMLAALYFESPIP